MRPMFLLLVAGVLAGCAGMAGERNSGKSAVADTRPVGPPQNCVPLHQIRESRVISDRIIDFHISGGKVLRNELPYSCPSLGFEKAFTFSTSLTQLCSTDIITVIHQGGGPGRGASCGLGKFQPVEGGPE